MRLFLATFILGFLLSLLAASVYPLPNAPRLRSDAAALANGGREESFFVRLPDDRLGSPRAAAVADFPTPAFASDGESRILAELFRVRNSEGRVIGLASKMSGEVAAGANWARENTDWMVLIPSRGALLGSTEGRPADETREYPVERMGFDIERSGLLVHGTDEFEGLTGFFMEIPTIDGVDENGQSQGQLELRFRMMGAPE